MNIQLYYAPVTCALAPYVTLDGGRRGVRRASA